MTTQNIISGANLFGSVAGSVTIKEKQNENDFGKLMSNSLISSKDTSVNTNHPALKKTSDQASEKSYHPKNDGSSSTNTKEDSVNVNRHSKADSTKVSVQKTKNSNQNVKDAKKVKDDDAQQDQTSTKDQQLITQIQGMLSQIQQVVMDKLNLSSEELNQLLSEQGIGLEDLLQPENLQQLLLANSGQTDIMSMLTDENLADTMKQLLQNLDDIKSDHQLGLTMDQIKALLDQAKVNAEEASGVTDFTNQTQDKTETLKQAETVAIQNNSDDKDTTSVPTSAETNTVSDVSNTGVTAKIESETQTNSNSDTNKDLKNSERFQTFVDNLVKVSQNVQSELNGETSQVTNLRDIANQIIERIKVSVTSDNTSMELQLNPESLGKVNLTVQSKEGVITAHFVVQNELSKEAIESQIQSLRDTLDQQGVKVDAIEVTVSANAFEQNHFKEPENQTDGKENKTGKHITLDDAMSMTDIPEEESSSEDVTGVRGTVVDYTA